MNTHKHLNKEIYVTDKSIVPKFDRASDREFSPCSSKLLFIPFIFLFLFIIGIGSVSAATCNGSGNVINSTTISDGCNLVTKGNYVMSGETFYLNGTVNGAIKIEGFDIVLDFNGSRLIGNYSQGASSSVSRGIRVDGYANFTLKNCYIDNYYRDLYYSKGRIYEGIENCYLNGTGVNTLFYIEKTVNVTFYNNTFNLISSYSSELSNTSYVTFDSNTWTNSSGYGVKLTNANNTLFINNIFNDIGLLWAYKNVTNLTITNNTGSRREETRIMYITHTKGLTIQDNNFTNIYSILVYNSSEVNFLRNHFYNLSRFIYLVNVSNSLIKDNHIELGDILIELMGGGNNTISNNIFKDAILDTDGYSSALHLRDFSDGSQPPNYNFIINNTFENYGCVGILLRGVNNTRIVNNTFNQKTLNDISLTDSRCGNEPTSAIFVSEIYKTYISTGTTYEMNYSNSSIHYSNNITLDDNAFNGNVSVFLRTQGTTNLFYDLANFWFSRFQFPRLLDIDSIFISNNFNNLSRVDDEHHLIDNNIQQGIKERYDWNISITKLYSSFRNNNNTDIDLFYIFNQTNSLISYSSGLASICNGDCNITLNPNEYAYVISNLSNLTEGVGKNTLVWFSLNTSSEKHISNNYSFTLYVPTYVSANCTNTYSVNYLSAYGIGYNYNRNYILDNCNLNVLYLGDIPVNPSPEGDNIFTFTYNNSYYCSELNQILTGKPCGLNESLNWFNLPYSNKTKVIQNNDTVTYYNYLIDFLIDDDCRNVSSLDYTSVNGNTYHYTSNDFTCNNVTNVLSVYLSEVKPSIVNHISTYACDRISQSNNALGNTLVNGTSLTEYYAYYGTYCTFYHGSACTSSMFNETEYQYTLFYQNYSTFFPEWVVGGNYSCYYRAYNPVTRENRFVQSFRFSGGTCGGYSYCWYYISYKLGHYSGETMPLYRDLLNTPLTYFERNCTVLDADIHNILTINYVSFNLPPPRRVFPEYFQIDWSQKIYLIILVLAFIIILLLLYFQRYFWAGFLTLIIGFFFLFSGILWIISLIVIAMGVIMFTVPKGTTLFVGG